MKGTPVLWIPQLVASTWPQRLSQSHPVEMFFRSATSICWSRKACYWSVHSRDTPDTLASCTFLVGWLSLTWAWVTVPQANLKTSVQEQRECHTRSQHFLCKSVWYLSLTYSASAAARGQEFATSVHPAAARLSVLWIRVMTAPTLGPSTCTLVRLQTCAHENLKDNSTRRRHCREYKNYLGGSGRDSQLKQFKRRKGLFNFFPSFPTFYFPTFGFRV